MTQFFPDKMAFSCTLSLGYNQCKIVLVNYLNGNAHKCRYDFLGHVGTVVHKFLINANLIPKPFISTSINVFAQS